MGTNTDGLNFAIALIGLIFIAIITIIVISVIKVTKNKKEKRCKFIGSPFLLNLQLGFEQNV